MISELESLDFELFLNDLKKDKNILALVFFGSFSKGIERPNSDIDLCIFKKDKKKEDSLFLEKLGNRKVDLVYYDKLPIQIQWKIMLEGKVIYSNDIFSFRRMKIRKMNEYFDQKEFYERNLKRLYNNI